VTAENLNWKLTENSTLASAARTFSESEKPESFMVRPSSLETTPSKLDLLSISPSNLDKIRTD